MNLFAIIELNKGLLITIFYDPHLLLTKYTVIKFIYSFELAQPIINSNTVEFIHIL